MPGTAVWVVEEKIPTEASFRGLPPFSEQPFEFVGTCTELRHKGKPASAVIFHYGGSEPAELRQRLRILEDRAAPLPVVLAAHAGSEALAVAAFRAGAVDYFSHPVRPKDLAESARRVSEPPPPASRLVGVSAAIEAVRRRIDCAAACASTVLIRGETGVGKEIVAREIHARSARAARPFVAVNASALPDGLLESELFGHERGAFTGAAGSRAGLFEAASGGTIFLDEVGDMSLNAQAKVLRALESREERRVGGRVAIPYDVRVIAATNRDLEQRMGEGVFRADLYYRLDVARIDIPPLRERREDIPALVDHFVSQLRRDFPRRVTGVDPAALEMLLGAPWTGNVRELRNALEAAFVNGRCPKLQPEDLPPRLASAPAETRDVASERDRLLTVLASTNWNKSKAARQLQWSRMTLYRKLHRYHLPLSKTR